MHHASHRLGGCSAAELQGQPCLLVILDRVSLKCPNWLCTCSEAQANLKFGILLFSLQSSCDWQPVLQNFSCFSLFPVFRVPLGLSRGRNLAFDHVSVTISM